MAGRKRPCHHDWAVMREPPPGIQGEEARNKSLLGPTLEAYGGEPVAASSDKAVAVHSEGGSRVPRFLGRLGVLGLHVLGFRRIHSHRTLSRERTLIRQSLVPPEFEARREERCSRRMNAGNRLAVPR